MATALVVGLSMAGAFEGVTMAVVMAATMAASMADQAIMQSQVDKPDVAPDQITPLDRTQLQAEGDVGKLQLGEEAENKRKRKKGKAAFKIEKETDTDISASTAVTAPEATTAGVQL